MAPAFPATAGMEGQDSSGDRPFINPEGNPDHGCPYEAQAKSIQIKTPEPQAELIDSGSQANSPSTPGQIAPFDWDDFESRYLQALSHADDHEKELGTEFENLVKVRQLMRYPLCAYISYS